MRAGGRVVADSVRTFTLREASYPGMHYIPRADVDMAALARSTHFSYRTNPAGVWDGTIQCEVIEVVPDERLAYWWRSGDAANVGYGAPLDTLVTFTLTPIAGGTRVRLVHSGFRLPRNAVAYDNMSKGWAKCARNLRDVAKDI